MSEGRRLQAESKAKLSEKTNWDSVYINRGSKSIFFIFSHRLLSIYNTLPTQSVRVSLQLILIDWKAS